ncbi:MAG TPA: hypothetical protein VK674_04485 [Candidatus Limnocylindria bacterium]|nr:hypothetical protein [Candidatus Limnocylindria bacterium]
MHVEYGFREERRRPRTVLALAGSGVIALAASTLILPDGQPKAQSQTANQTDAAKTTEGEICTWHTELTAEGGYAQTFDLADGTVLEVAGSAEQGLDLDELYETESLNDGDKVFREHRFPGVYSFVLDEDGYVLDAARAGDSTDACKELERTLPTPP